MLTTGVIVPKGPMMESCRPACGIALLLLILTCVAVVVLVVLPGGPFSFDLGDPVGESDQLPGEARMLDLEVADRGVGAVASDPVPGNAGAQPLELVVNFPNRSGQCSDSRMLLLLAPCAAEPGLGLEA